MAKPFTSNRLIESVKRRAAIPENQVTFAPEDFLAFANEEISLGMLPSIMRLHEDYLLFEQEVDLQNAISNYSIPHRAIGNKLRDLAFKDVNDNIYEMTRIPIDNESQYQGSYTANTVSAFYIKNNEVVLVPKITGDTSGTLVFRYYIRPNEMVEEDQASIITNINTVTGEISVDQIPDNFSLSNKYDLIKSKSPFNHLEISLTPSAINTTTNVITFDPNDLPSSLAVGDYINLEEETIVPQIPIDLHVVLAHRVATRCLEAQGDSEGLGNANKKLAEMEMNTTNIIDNRVEGSPQKVVQKNSPLMSGLYRRRYRYRG